MKRTPDYRDMWIRESDRVRELFRLIHFFRDVAEVAQRVPADELGDLFKLIQTRCQRATRGHGNLEDIREALSPRRRRRPARKN